jgi:hypothetical protein
VVHICNIAMREIVGRRILVQGQPQAK